MPIFGKEVREKWPIDADYKTISVITTGEPGRIHEGIAFGIRFLIWLLLPMAMVVLFYCAYKSAIYPAELRAAAWQRDMSQIGPDFAMFLESMR